MQRFKNILCVITVNAEDSSILERAATLAENNQALLTVMEAIEEVPPSTKLLEQHLPPHNLKEKIVEEHRISIDKKVAPWRKNIEIQTRAVIGIPFLEIIREVLRNRHDLLIKPAEDGGVLDRFFGSNDMHLLRKCPCPVWIVKPDASGNYQRIVAAVDVDDFYPQEELDARRRLNIQILQMAASLALSEFAELHVVAVWDAIGDRFISGVFNEVPEQKITSYIEHVRQQNAASLNRLMHEAMGKMEQEAADYLKPQTHLIKGTPRKAVPAFAREMEADLVVMGTVARTGISGLFMGNTAETILNHLDCSILAVKPPGFTTPVTLEESG